MCSSDLVDGLRQELRRRQKEAHHYITTAARLIAPTLDRRDWSAGYAWVIDALKQDHKQLASEMEIEKALQHLKHREFEKAIETLKHLEKKEERVRVMAATNLSFIYFLEGDLTSAERYAKLAYEHDRYNANALVNMGNCLAAKGDGEVARQCYLEAIGVEASCVEAIYNLGLINLRLGHHDEAQRCFEKLHTINPNNPEVIFQIANLHERQMNVHGAVKWYNLLTTYVPADAAVLSRLGAIFSKAEDESQAFHYHLES